MSDSECTQLPELHTSTLSVLLCVFCIMRCTRVVKFYFTCQNHHFYIVQDTYLIQVNIHTFFQDLCISIRSCFPNYPSIRRLGPVSLTGHFPVSITNNFSADSSSIISFRIRIESSSVISLQPCNNTRVTKYVNLCFTLLCCQTTLRTRARFRNTFRPNYFCLCCGSQTNINPIFS